MPCSPDIVSPKTSLRWPLRGNNPQPSSRQQPPSNPRTKKTELTPSFLRRSKSIYGRLTGLDNQRKEPFSEDGHLMGKDNYEVWIVWQLPRSIISHNVAGSSNQNKSKRGRPVILELSAREAGSGTVCRVHLTLSVNGTDGYQYNVSWSFQVTHTQEHPSPPSVQRGTC